MTGEENAELQYHVESCICVLLYYLIIITVENFPPVGMFERLLNFGVLSCQTSCELQMHMQSDHIHASKVSQDQILSWHSSSSNRYLDNSQMRGVSSDTTTATCNWRGWGQKFRTVTTSSGSSAAGRLGSGRGNRSGRGQPGNLDMEEEERQNERITEYRV